MKKKFRVAVCLIAFLFALFALSAPLAGAARAEDVTYDDSGTLRTDVALANANNGDGSVIPAGPSKNKVTVDFTTVTQPYRVFGGLSNMAPVTENEATLTNGTIANGFFGGYDASPIGIDGLGYGAFSNKVVITNGTISGGTLGSVTDVAAVAGLSENGSATGNDVELNGGTFNGTDPKIIGGWALTAAGEASGNSVTVNAANSASIYGGYSAGAASYNSVKLQTGAVNTIVGGFANGSGSDAMNNRVEITGGEVKGDVYGGSGTSARAGSNTVIIDGSVNFTGANPEITGGKGGSAHDNVVILSGNQSTNLSNVALHGGMATDPDGSSGNILNAVNFTGEVKSIQDFQYINFVLPDTLTANAAETTVIEVTDTAAIDFNNVNIDITGILGAGPLPEDAAVTLIKFASVGYTGSPTVGGSPIDTTSNSTSCGEWKFVLDSTSLTATLVSDPAPDYMDYYKDKVTDITRKFAEPLTVIQATEGITLDGNIVPDDIPYIEAAQWKLVNAGTTEAQPLGESYTFVATEPGKAIVRAIVSNGIAPGWDYTKDFVITVLEELPPPPPPPTGGGAPSYAPSDKTGPIQVSVTLDDGVTYKGKLQEGTKTYLLTLPHGTDTTRLPVKVTVPFGADVDPESETERDFSAGPLEYTITAENGYTKDTIEVLVQLSAPDIPEPTEPAPTEPMRSSGGGCDAGAGMAGAFALALVLSKALR